MSDFFRNLAIRTSRAEQVIQPRLPSLFEPSRAADGSLTKVGLASAEPHSQMPDEISRPNDLTEGPIRARSSEGPFTAPLVAPSQPTAAPPAPTVERPEKTQAPTAQAGARHGGKTPDPFRSLHETSPERTYRQVHVPAPDPEAQQSLSPKLSRPTSLRSSAEETLRKALPITGQRAVQASSDSNTTRNRPENKANNERASAFREDSIRPAMPGVLPAEYVTRLARSMHQPRVESSADTKRGSRSSESSSQETTIHVTIGRIEIRGSQQQQTAPKERTSSPVMSLDEYLRQKRAGA